MAEPQNNHPDPAQQAKKIAGHLQKEDNELQIFHRRLAKVVEDSFDDLQAFIQRRKLFVMFEPELNCDPETDHEQAKDVWPLFGPAVELSKRRIIAEMLPILYSYIDEHEKEEK